MRSNFTRKFCSIFISVSFCLIAVRADAQSAEQLFRDGITAYQKNDLDQARTLFTNSLKAAPDNVDCLYNLGLTELKAKHVGLALGLWRKALAIEPSNDEISSAINFADQSLSQKPFNRSSDAFESLHQSFLEKTSLTKFIIANLLLFAFAGWILIRYLAAKNRAADSEEPTPAIPYIGIFFVLLLLISLIGLVAKTYDLTVSRATITAQKVEAKTSPDTQATTLFELFEGLEVVVRQSSGDWMQVTQPGGLSGWVPADSVLVTSGRQQ